MRKIFCLEWRKLASQRGMAALALGIFLFFIVLVVVIFYTGDARNSEVPDADERPELIQSYRARIEEIESQLAQPGLVTDRAEREMLNYECEMCRYFVQSQTVLQDYLEPGAVMNRTQGLETAGFAVLLAKVALYLMLLATTILTAWVFAAEYGLTYKSVLAAPIDRRAVFTGKCAFAACILGTMLFSMFAVSLCCSFASDAKFLVFRGAFRSISVTEYVLQFYLGILAVTLFTFGIAALSAVLSRRLLFAGFSGPVVYFICLATAVVVTGGYNVFLAFNSGWHILNCFPIIGILNYGGGFDWPFAVQALAHALLGGLLAFISARVFEKQDL